MAAMAEAMAEAMTVAVVAVTVAVVVVSVAVVAADLDKNAADATDDRRRAPASASVDETFPTFLRASSIAVVTSTRSAEPARERKIGRGGYARS